MIKRVLILIVAVFFNLCRPALANSQCFIDEERDIIFLKQTFKPKIRLGMYYCVLFSEGLEHYKQIKNTYFQDSKSTISLKHVPDMPETESGTDYTEATNEVLYSEKDAVSLNNNIKQDPDQLMENVSLMLDTAKNKIDSEEANKKESETISDKEFNDLLRIYDFRMPSNYRIIVR